MCTGTGWLDYQGPVNKGRFLFFFIFYKILNKETNMAHTQHHLWLPDLHINDCSSQVHDAVLIKLLIQVMTSYRSDWEYREINKHSSMISNQPFTYYVKCMYYAWGILAYIEFSLTVNNGKLLYMNMLSVW